MITYKSCGADIPEVIMKLLVNTAIDFMNTYDTIRALKAPLKYVFSASYGYHSNKICASSDVLFEESNPFQESNAQFIPVELQNADVQAVGEDIILINWTKIRNWHNWQIKGVMVHETSHYFDYCAYRQFAQELGTTLSDVYSCMMITILSNQSEVRAKYYQELYSSENGGPTYIREFQEMKSLSPQSTGLQKRDYAFARASAYIKRWEEFFDKESDHMRKAKELADNLKSLYGEYKEVYQKQHNELFKLESLRKMWEADWDFQMVRIEAYKFIQPLAKQIIDGFYAISEILNANQAISETLEEALIEIEQYGKGGTLFRDRLKKYPDNCCVEASMILANAFRKKYDDVECIKMWYGKYGDATKFHVWVRCEDVHVDITLEQYSEEKLRQPLISLQHPFVQKGYVVNKYWEKHHFVTTGEPQNQPVMQEHFLLSDFLLSQIHT